MFLRLYTHIDPHTDIAKYDGKGWTGQKVVGHLNMENNNDSKKMTVAFDTGISEKMTLWLLCTCLNFYIK